MYASWTDRIAGWRAPHRDAGAAAGPGAQRRHHDVGLGGSESVAHDEIATDKRNPTVNANGPIYGALEESADYMPVVDPTRHAPAR